MDAIRSPGIREPLHPAVLGAIIGAGGATAFVMVNRPFLPDPWPILALVGWAAAAAVFVWAVFLRTRTLSVVRPEPEAGRVYLLSVAAMIAVIAGGAWLLRRGGHAELQPALVVLAVGAHFVPFARAFKSPVFAAIGWALALVGAVGMVLGLWLGGAAPRATAVISGVVMLGLMALDAWRERA